ncbi:restriction endonuclease subunit S [Vibrio nigripulchritudo]|uniref:restriction endonuclease subunit S n=1 Tax=Vibrio nigripulchritudo TaxID=28173 RepID=UPI002490C3C6|nr:restriction endonuclease subunit S [Vibrio nigripulchritudo]BDU40842.1 hypothetical protein TUMSATVNIG2_53110 [Vibrio nigripulchritudo]BDU46579.1 hypothetical protein TUMSATVNIG3_53770 [Vibrio nigripulchritudo]
MKVKLQDIADIRAGHPFRGSIKESADGNGFVIQVRDQDEYGNIHWNALVKADIGGRKEPEWLQPGDIVFAARGVRNLATHIADINKPVVCSPHFFQLRVNRDKVLPEFIAWQINHTLVQRYFLQSAEGSVQVSIKRAVLEQTPISIPPLEKQRLLMKLVTSAEQEKQAYQHLIALRHNELDAIATQVLNEL